MKTDCSTFQCTIYLPCLSILECLNIFFIIFTSIFSLVSYSRGRHSWFQVFPFSHSSVVPFYASHFFSEWLLTITMPRIMCPEILQIYMGEKNCSKIISTSNEARLWNPPTVENSDLAT